MERRSWQSNPAHFYPDPSRNVRDEGDRLVVDRDDPAFLQGIVDVAGWQHGIAVCELPADIANCSRTVHENRIGKPRRQSRTAHDGKHVAGE